MTSATLLQAILRRRSVRPRRLAEPGPTPGDLRTIAAAGLRGPDHGRLRAWRLLHITDRASLAEAFVAAEHELRPSGSDEMLVRATERANNGPCLLALIVRIETDHPEVPVHEQWAATGAALNQMLLAADALGYAGGILSGRKTQTAALRSALHIAEDEHIVGFLTFGTPAADPPTPPAADPSEFIEEWPSSKP